MSRLLTMLLFSMTSNVFAAPPLRPNALGQWQDRDGRTSISIHLGEVLTAKQRSILQAGFNAVSQVAVWPASQELDEHSSTAPKAYAASRCSVKYDAWEESFNITKLDGAPKPALGKSIQDFAEVCLNLEITSSAVLDALATSGGELKATIAIKQMTAEDAAKTKAWLVRQQSSLMQSLFTHMLGELDLSEREIIKVTVPARPIAVKTIEQGPL